MYLAEEIDVDSYRKVSEYTVHWKLAVLAV